MSWKTLRNAMFLCGDPDAFATLCFCLCLDWRSSSGTGLRLLLNVT